MSLSLCVSLCVSASLSVSTCYIYIGRSRYQPCPKWAADLRKDNPGQPTIWTEDQGWFDQWGIAPLSASLSLPVPLCVSLCVYVLYILAGAGVAKRVRDSRDQLYGIARFMAHGGVTLSLTLSVCPTVSLTVSDSL